MKRRLLNLAILVATVAACSPSSTTTTPPGSAATGTSNTSAATASATPAPVWSPRPAAELAWTFKTEGSIWGSATVAAGVAYIGSNDGKLYAVDVKSGAKKWDFPTGGEVRSKPAAAGNAVVFASDDGNVYAIDLAGKELWTTDIKSNAKRLPLTDPSIATTFEFDFLSSSPVVAGDRVFVGSADGGVYALELATGKVAWRVATGDRVRATPAVADGVVYIGSWDGYLYALKADTGEQLWKFDAADRILTPKYFVQPIQSTALVRDGVVYFASRKAATFAVNAKTGKQLWETSNGSGNWLESSPVVSGRMVYIGTSAAAQLNVMYADTGAQNSFSIGAYAWSTPLPLGDVVFIGAEANTQASNADQAGVHAINVAGGLPTEQRWFFPVNDTIEPASFNGVNSTPVFDGGFLYFGGLDGKLYALAV